MDAKKPKIILIGGPTASGKSALAMELARKEHGTIINADAMQIYSGLPILTAQPGASEQKEISHELYGVTDSSQRSSAGKWLALATAAIDKAVAAERTPILVGGTGLYFKALSGGLADIPPIPEVMRERAQKLYDEIGEEDFRDELAKFDPESAARLVKNDRQRLVRAYEVAAHTGKPIGEWQKRGAGLGSRYLEKKSQMLNVEHHLLMPPREELYAACNKRFLQMVERGAIEEVRALLARTLDPGLPAMKILGVREIAAYLQGEISLDTAIARAQQATRNYAKRQMTWFRNQWTISL